MIVTVQGLVAAVDGGQLILNVGAKAGVKVGDQLNVERVTKEIKDPATGQVLRRLSCRWSGVTDEEATLDRQFPYSGFNGGRGAKYRTQ